EARTRDTTSNAAPVAAPATTRPNDFLSRTRGRFARKAVTGALSEPTSIHRVALMRLSALVCVRVPFRGPIVMKATAKTKRMTVSGRTARTRTGAKFSWHGEARHGPK